MTGHVRQRSQGSFELRYRAAGKTVSTTFRGTKRQAEQELRRLLTDIDRGGRGPSSFTPTPQTGLFFLRPADGCYSAVDA